MRVLYPLGWFPFLPPRAKETNKWHPRMDEGAGVMGTLGTPRGLPSVTTYCSTLGKVMAMGGG